MYQLNDEQVASLEAFIGKIPESIIRAKVEKWLSEVEPTRRVTGEQMERFVEFNVHVPKEVQYFPTSFALAVKNTPETEKREANGEVTETANLIDTVDESIQDVPDVDAPSDIEDNEHIPSKRTYTKSSKSAKGKSAAKKK